MEEGERGGRGRKRWKREKGKWKREKGRKGSANGERVQKERVEEKGRRAGKEKVGW